MKNKNEQYYIIRCDRASVFFGQIAERNRQEVTIRNARRIWYWEGANELCALAAEGTTRPEKCKFSVPVDELVVLDAIELIPCTDKAAASIMGVPEWRLR